MRPFWPRTGGGRHATEMLWDDVASHRIVSGGRLGAAGRARVRPRRGRGHGGGGGHGWGRGVHLEEWVGGGHGFEAPLGKLGMLLPGERSGAPRSQVSSDLKAGVNRDHMTSRFTRLLSF